MTTGQWSVTVTGSQQNQITVASPGPQGPRGSTIHQVSAAPAASLGTDGDYALDTVSARLYGPKTAGSWGSGISLVGSARNYITFSRAGNLATGVGTFRWYSKGSWTIIDVRATVGTPSTGADVIVDVNKNGTSIFPTNPRPTIVQTTNTIVATPNTTALVDGDYITVDIDQIGSTTPGADLMVQINFQVT